MLFFFSVNKLLFYVEECVQLLSSMQGFLLFFKRCVDLVNGIFGNCDLLPSPSSAAVYDLFIV